MGNAIKSALAAALCAAPILAFAKIDREAVVGRHNIELSEVREKSPSQVGNGEFVFNFDITGLQTLTPFNTMSHWGWHSNPMPEGMGNRNDFKGLIIKTNGRDVAYPSSERSLAVFSKTYRDNPTSPMTPQQAKFAEWLSKNPHAINLGRIGFEITKADGSVVADKSDIENARQTIRLYEGIAESSFSVNGKRADVETLVSPSSDTVAVRTNSQLISEGRLKVFFEFPAPDDREFNDFVGCRNKPELHKSEIVNVGENFALVKRTLGDTVYYVKISWETPAGFSADKNNPHKFHLSPKGEKLAFSANFSKTEPRGGSPAFAETQADCKKAWNNYWRSGAAMDLSESSDPRWRELERRIVLSQYLMRINCAGSLPPQESGLLSNSWFGRFHWEMIWWHAAHFAKWGRPELAKGQFSVYKTYLADAVKRAKDQGYKGARWPKCTGDVFSEWPHIIHSTLVWQQPHPIYFAEYFYRASPTRETLDEWKDVVFETAEFMADFPVLNRDTKKYDLAPPLFIVSENTDPLTTRNPSFELAYWRYGLRTALEWQKRLGIPENKKWREVLENLAPLPEQDGVYVTHEGIKDMWTKFNYEHPAPTGAFGWLAGDGVDIPTFRKTFDKVMLEWKFDKVWGWDFPMLAMAAARCGNKEAAIKLLLYPSKQFDFDEHAIATGGPCPYFPSNGGFLAAVAMLAGGWDGATTSEFDPEHLAFPKNGWKVKAEGFKKSQ